VGPTRRRSLLAVAVAIAVAAVAYAQRRFDDFGFGGYRGRVPAIHNVPYDGRFTFVRVKYETAPGGYWAGGRPSWVHGFPIAEQNLMRIMTDMSSLNPHVDDINVLTLDDPELFRYPIAYIIFKIIGWRGIDTGGWEPFAQNMNRVLPGVQFIEMEASHPIFHSFFELNEQKLDDVPQAYNSGRPVFRGVYEDNDPNKRLVMIINYNTDVSQFWEWSGRGLRPVDDTNEAYKLGVNYLMYGITH
jgi:Domain of unknown function (DUF4159)